MAETSERPTAVTPTPTPAPAPPVAPPGAESVEPYRPLSLLAIAAFCLGALFAFVVVLGGLAIFAGRYPGLLLLLAALAVLLGPLRALMVRDRRLGRLAAVSGGALGVLATAIGLSSLVAFSGSSPWLVPAYLLPVGVLALACAWLAKTRIQSSENALSGAGLARWGTGLTVFFGLTYLAYLASSTVAVRSQAQACAEEYLSLIRDEQPGKLEEAFLLTMPVKSRPPQGENIRRTLEVQHNTVRGPAEPGAWSAFTRDAFVRLIRNGKGETTWKLRSTQSNFERGAYQVALVYQVSTPRGEFDVQVMTNGVEVADSSGALRRQWHVDLSGSGLLESSRKSNPKGMTMIRGQAAATELLGEWTARLRDRQIDAAYLETLPPEQRRAQAAASMLDKPALVALVGVGAAGSSGATREARDAYRKGREAFRKGSLIDLKDFWADPAFKDTMVQEVHHLFAGTSTTAIDFTPMRSEVAGYQEKDGEATVTLGARLMVRDKEGKPEFFLEADIDVVGPVAVAPMRGSDYRVAGFRLQRGQTAPAEVGGPRRR